MSSLYRCPRHPEEPERSDCRIEHDEIERQRSLVLLACCALVAFAIGAQTCAGHADEVRAEREGRLLGRLEGCQP